MFENIDLTILKELFQRILIIILTIGSTYFVYSCFSSFGKYCDREIKADEIAKILDRKL